MFFVLYLHHIFAVVLVTLSLFLIFSRNPVYSVLFLIVIFFTAASILILFTVDFIGLLFVVIYVGAIAVLFLFVVMMLDMKTQGILFSVSAVQNVLIFFLCIFFFDLIYNSKILTIFNRDYLSFFVFVVGLDSFNSIDAFGVYLYSFFIPFFLIAGIILLVAMLGSISLTLKYRSFRKNQLVSKQLARTNVFVSFFS